MSRIEGCDISNVLVTLTELELKGLIKKHIVIILFSNEFSQSIKIRALITLNYYLSKLYNILITK